MILKINLYNFMRVYFLSNKALIKIWSAEENLTTVLMYKKDYKITQ